MRKGSKLALVAAGLGAAVVAREALGRLRAIDLSHQVVLITGASRGLGYAMAEEFGHQGARLVICARNAEQLERTRKELEQQGVEVLAVQCDVSDPAQVDHMVNQAIQRFGRIDVLVNNAGVITVGPVEVQCREDFEEAMDVIFWGAVNPTLAVLSGMIERGSGRIANITSIGGRVSVPHLLPYNCAKFALVRLFRRTAFRAGARRHKSHHCRAGADAHRFTPERRVQRTAPGGVHLV